MRVALLGMVLALAVCSTASAVRAEIDPVMIEWQQQRPASLRWDNVEGRPYLISGPAPRYRSDAKQHVVELATDQPLTLWLPGKEKLRIRALEGETKGIEAWGSLSGGLYRRLIVRLTQDRREALVETGEDLAVLVRLTAPRLVHAALFVSRHGMGGEIDPYRDELSGDGTSGTLRGSDHAWEEMTRVGPGMPLIAETIGPVRVRLQVRFLYAADEPLALRKYRVSVSLDGKPWRDLLLTATPQRRGAPSVGWETTGIGPEDNVLLDLPTGRHRIEVKSSAKIMATLVSKAENDFLFPDLNAPKPSLDEVKAGGVYSAPVVPSFFKKSASPFPSDLEQQARSMAWDLRQLGGGAAAAALMEREANRNPFLSEIGKAARTLSEEATHYRPLELESAGPWDERFSAIAFRPRLANPTVPPMGSLQGSTQAAFLMRRLGVTVFHRLPAGARALTFLVPMTTAPTRLRISIPLSETKMTYRLKLIIDGGVSMPLLVEPSPELPSHAMLPDPAAAALVSAGGQLPAGSVERVVGVEIPLPAGIRTLAIAGERGAPQSRVAVELRESRLFTLDGQTYLDAILHVGGADERLLTALQKVTAARPDCGIPDVAACLPTVGNGPSRAEEIWLHNDWLPLLRLVRARVAGFALEIEPLPPSHGSDPRRAVSLTQQAQQLIEAGQSVAALEAWSEAARLGDRNTRAQTWRGVVEALDSAGEVFLAEHVLRSAMLFEPVGELARWAHDKLLDRTDPGELDILTTIEAAWLGRVGLPAAGPLAAKLAREGLVEEALKLGVLLPVEAQPRDELALASLQAGWGTSNLSDGSEVWHSARAEGERIRRRLVSPDIAERVESLKQWADWWRRHPGPRHWVNADSLIDGHAGAVRLKVLGREVTLTAFRAEEEQPLTLWAVGPASLRFELRGLHPEGESARTLDRWASLVVDGHERPVPMSNNFPASWLVLEAGGQRPGNAENILVDLPAGLHRLSLRAEGKPLLVRLERFDPLVSAGPLSAVEPALARDLLAGRFALLAGSSGSPWHEVQPGEWPALNSLGSEPGINDGFVALSYALSPAPFEDKAVSVVQKLESLAYDIEHAAETPFAKVAAAAVLANAQPISLKVARLWTRMHRVGLRWEPVSPIRSAGLNQITVKGWQPENPLLRARRALMPPLPDTALVITSDETLTLNVGSLPQIKGVILPLAIAGSSLSPMVLEVTEGKRRRRITLNDEKGVLVSLAGGAALRIDNPLTGQVAAFVFKDVSGGIGEMSSQRRTYHVATQSEPVIVSLDGPAWLRVDEVRDGVVFSRTLAMEVGFHDLELKPDGSRAMAFFRVFRQVPSGRASVHSPQAAPYNGISLPVASAPPADPEPSGPIRFVDRLPLGRQEDGTSSVHSSVLRRPRVDPEGDGGGPGFTAYEMGFTRRYFELESGTYWRGDVVLRQDEHNQPLAGIGGLLQRPVGMGGATAFASADLMGQQADDISHPAWAGIIRLEMAQSWIFSPKTTLRLSGDGFGRIMSVRSEEARRVQLDPDVWSVFKSDHLFGLGSGLQLMHAPWLDSRGWVRLNAETTSNLKRLDRLIAHTGLSQLFGPVQVHIGHRIRRLLETNDRPQALWRNEPTLGLAWEHWLEGSQRLVVALEANHGIETDNTRIALTISLHFGAGREYRDFMPGAAGSHPSMIGFHSLANMKVAEQIWNNEIVSYDGR